MLEAERQFRRIIDYQQLAGLVVAVEREITAQIVTHIPTEEPIPAERHPGRRRSSTAIGTSSFMVRLPFMCRAGE